MTRQRVAGVARTLALAVMLLALFVHETDTSSAQGEAIFARAVLAAKSSAYPHYTSYAVGVSFINGRHHVSDTWDTAEDLTDGVVIASIFSREEHASPSAPSGSNIRWSLSIASDGLSRGATYSSAPLNPMRPGDPVGPVAFAVDQNFGLTPPRAYTVLHDVRSFADAANGLATIGRTGADAQRYRVALLDVNDGVDHLGLTPLRDPYHNRLRELWVEQNTAFVDEAIVAGIADRAPLDRIRWDVLFTRKDGGTYVAEEDALEPLDYGGAGHLRDVRITFDDLELSSHFPFKYTFGISTPVLTLHDP